MLQVWFSQIHEAISYQCETETYAGRNGGHLTQNVASSFISRQAKHNSTEAVKTYLVEEYTAKKLVKFIKDRGLEDTVDLVEGGHITLFHTAEEESNVRADWEAAREAGYEASVRWIGNEELKEVSTVPFFLCVQR